MRPSKSALSVKRAKRFRRQLTKPELLLWQILRTSPSGYKFRNQHPAGPYILDFFCARANLAIEVDGYAHDTDGRPEQDYIRDQWLRNNHIDTLRIPARDVLKNPTEVANAILTTVENRLLRFGKVLAKPLGDTVIDKAEEKKWDREV